MKKYYVFLILLVLFSSCKDTDSDNIYDKDDECPETYGIAEFNGCPNTDEDGIPDNEDDCPETYGYERYNGCPNNDHLQLLVSECFNLFSFTSDEIDQLFLKFEYNLNSTINVGGVCNVLVEMTFMN